MKKQLAFMAFITGLSFASAQEINSSARPGIAHQMKFAADQYIYNKPSENQENLHLASAFNGWLYAAYTVNDTLSHKGGISVRYSKDGGITWMHFLNYQYTNSFYPLTGIVVAGTDTNNLSVFIAGVLKTISTGNYSVYVDKFDGRNGNLIAGQIYVHTLGSMPVYDIALASDYLFPASSSMPYSVGFLYSQKGPVQDSLVFALSTDGGTTFGARRALSASSRAFRKVALAYARSATASNGSYFAAWESRISSSNTLGHIYTSHTTATINSSWSLPLCLDSLSALTNGWVRNPTLACQYSLLDNDSSNATVLIGFECAVSGNTNDFDIMGYANNRALIGNYWRRFDVNPGPENDLQPQVIYDPISANFMLTYYDSTNGYLPYALHDVNMILPNSWTYETAHYNDQTSTLNAPCPTLSLNPVYDEPAFAWIALNSNQKGCALFDAQYAGVMTGTDSPPLKLSRLEIFPNPVSGFATISLSGNTGDQLHLGIYDMLGNAVTPLLQEANGSISNQFQLDVSGLADGLYVCNLQVGKENQSLRFVVHH
jgi:hypothetical protein